MEPATSSHGISKNLHEDCEGMWLGCSETVSSNLPVLGKEVTMIRGHGLEHCLVHQYVRLFGVQMIATVLYQSIFTLLLLLFARTNFSVFSD